MVLISSFDSVLSARSFKVTAVFLVILIFILASVRSSFESPAALPVTRGCPSKISDDDFSPIAIRCRIKTAQTRAQIGRKSQSSTPEQAVVEYKSRYKRDPPKGFEQWVQFALDHDSKIIDDFDQIDRDLRPYRTAEGRRVFQELKDLDEDSPRTRRVFVQNGSMSTSQGYMYEDEWRRLLEPFVEILPDSVFFMSLIDEPRILSTSGPSPNTVYFQNRNGEPVGDLVKDSCAQLPRELTSRLGVAKDVCQFSHPETLHALIASPSTFSYTHSLAPIMSFGRMSAFRDILIPCPCYLAHPFPEEKDPIPFLEKKPGVYWRGSSTGGQATRSTWQFGHRERFVAFVQSLQNAANVLDAGHFMGAKVDGVDEKQIKLFKDGLDIHMGAYIQCDDEACKDMERVLGPADVEPEDVSSSYRYLFDIDGNSMSTRFYRLLSQNAVVLKQTWFQEWHDDRLIPWAHYIPVTMDMKEFPALMNFLVNDPEGETLSAEIAHAGASWSRRVLREVDMAIYVYRLLLEMADFYNGDEFAKGI